MNKFFKAVAGSALGFGLLGGAHQVLATELILPEADDEMATLSYNDFEVYSFDLLQQCAAALDPRCVEYQNLESSQPLAPPTENIGAISDEMIIYTGESGVPVDNDSNDGPFPSGSQGDAGGTLVDNAFSPDQGSVTSFEMTGDDPTTTDVNESNEPGGRGSDPFPNSTPEFTGDIDGRWDASLANVLEYLTDPTGQIYDLVFLFGDNQDGADVDQWLYIWAQVRILSFDASGDIDSLIACYELSTYTTGCQDTGDDPNPNYDPLDPFNLDPTDGMTNDYVPVVGNFCVDKVTGESYDIGLAGNDGDCAIDDATGDPRDGYYISNNLGNNDAEFAAYIQELNDNLVLWASMGYYMSVNIKMENLTDGDETAWACDRCLLQDQELPTPAPIALLGLGLLGLHITRRRLAATG